MSARPSPSPQPPQPADIRERFVYPEEATIDRPISWAQVKRLLSYMVPYRKQIGMALVVTVVGAASRLAVPYLLSRAVDHGIVPGRPDVLSQVVAILLFTYVTGWVATGRRIQMTNQIGQSVLRDLRHRLFEHVESLSFHFFDRRSAGSILVRIINDVNAMQELFTNGVVNVLMDLLVLIGIVTIMLSLHTQLALASFVILPIMILLSTELRRQIRRAWRDVRRRLSRLNAHLAEAIQGMRVTEAYVQERANMMYFENMNNDYRQAMNRSTRVADLFEPLVEITAAIGTCIVLWYGAALILNEQLTLGVLIAFTSYLNLFWQPVSRLGQMYNQLLAAMASSERIFEFMDTQPVVAEAENPIELTPMKGHVRFEDVTFEYAPGRPALHRVSLDVQPGQTIALVGPTGSGKTSIVNLVARFYDVTSGRVLIDGVDVRDLSLRTLRTQIGFVLQDTFLFSGTIIDNLRFGRPDADFEAVQAAAAAVGADDFIRELPDGYETIVSERGGGLSLGQRQLISFARALLADPRILILDEATASIDTETEVRVQNALERLLKGRTAFVVAHRLSTIRNADRIVVLDHGRVIESGTHDELILQRGLYHKLVEAQFRFLAE